MSQPNCDDKIQKRDVLTFEEGEGAESLALLAPPQFYSILRILDIPRIVVVVVLGAGHAAHVHQPAESPLAELLDGPGDAEDLSGQQRLGWVVDTEYPFPGSHLSSSLFASLQQQ